jgi:hypothetical protein
MLTQQLSNGKKLTLRPAEMLMQQPSNGKKLMHSPGKMPQFNVHSRSAHNNHVRSVRNRLALPQGPLNAKNVVKSYNLK